MPQFQMAYFRTDVTPPVGHPLCGGFVQPVIGVSEPLIAQGIVLLEHTQLPIVLCTVDWCEIRNAHYDFWLAQIASAVGTSPDRVIVHCVHQHNAPIADTEMNQLAADAPGNLFVMDVGWCEEAANKTAQAAKKSLGSLTTITHIGTGQAQVHEIASARRLMNSSGKVESVRWSACPDPVLRAAPEGTIDPMLKTVSFWNNDKKLVSLHHYATHPMSYYGDGIVTSDFVGLARERCVQEDNGTPHLCFTGCAGDITAGKYNDGTPVSRSHLAERLYSAIRESEKQPELAPLERLGWKTQDIHLPENMERSAEHLRSLLMDESNTTAARIGAAFELSFKERLQTRPALTISCLTLGDCIRMIYLPGEPFIDYQISAQKYLPDLFVTVSGYGDGGPGYIPLAHSYAEGGYEPTGAFVGPESEAILKNAIQTLMFS